MALSSNETVNQGKVTDLEGRTVVVGPDGGTIDVSFEAGDLNIGNVDVASIAAGDNNIGNVDLASAIPAGTAHIGTVANIHDSDSIRTGGANAVPKFAVIDHATSGDNTIVAQVASKKIRVVNVVLVAAAAVTVRFESGAGGTALTGQIQLAANGGFAPGFCPVGHFETAVNTLLNLELSGATSVDGWITYIEV